MKLPILITVPIIDWMSTMDQKYRQSRQRDMILKMLRKTDTHPTVDWIYEKMKKEFPKLSLGTVYRNVSILIEQGLVQRIQSGSTFDRYEANTAVHYHLICERCGKIIDFNMPVNAELEKIASKMTNFKILRHRINFYGLCPDCKKKE